MMEAGVLPRRRRSSLRFCCCINSWFFVVVYEICVGELIYCRILDVQARADVTALLLLPFQIIVSR